MADFAKDYSWWIEKPANEKNLDENLTSSLYMDEDGPNYAV